MINKIEYHNAQLDEFIRFLSDRWHIRAF